MNLQVKSSYKLLLWLKNIYKQKKFAHKQNVGKYLKVWKPL